MTLPFDTMGAVLRVIKLVSQGHTLTDACDKASVSYSTFRQHVNANAELSAIWTDAEQRGYDVMADMLLNIFTDTLYGESEPKKAKIISDNIKWYLARKRPHLYGDKSVVEHQFTADKTIVEALQRGRDAVANAVIDATYTVIKEEVAATLPPELEQFA